MSSLQHFFGTPSLSLPAPDRPVPPTTVAGRAELAQHLKSFDQIAYEEVLAGRDPFLAKFNDDLYGRRETPFHFHPRHSTWTKGFLAKCLPPEALVELITEEERTLYCEALSACRELRVALEELTTAEAQVMFKAQSKRLDSLLANPVDGDFWDGDEIKSDFARRRRVLKEARRVHYATAEKVRAAVATRLRLFFRQLAFQWDEEERALAFEWCAPFAPSGRLLTAIGAGFNLKGETFGGFSEPRPDDALAELIRLRDEYLDSLQQPPALSQKTK